MTSLVQGLFGLVILVLGIPLYLGKVPPNSLYGLRTRKTLENKEIWYRANRFAGLVLVLGGGVVLLAWALVPRSAFEGPWGLAILLGVVVLALVLSTAYAARL